MSFFLDMVKMKRVAYYYAIRFAMHQTAILFQRISHNSIRFFGIQFRYETDTTAFCSIAGKGHQVIPVRTTSGLCQIELAGAGYELPQTLNHSPVISINAKRTNGQFFK